jgi:hypothetical protein
MLLRHNTAVTTPVISPLIFGIWISFDTVPRVDVVGLGQDHESPFSVKREVRPNEKNPSGITEFRGTY